MARYEAALNVQNGFDRQSLADKIDEASDKRLSSKPLFIATGVAIATEAIAMAALNGSSQASEIVRNAQLVLGAGIWLQSLNAIELAAARGKNPGKLPVSTIIGPLLAHMIRGNNPNKR